MVECRGGAGLSLKTLQRLAIPGKFFRQEFERHQAAELGVLGLVDDTHAATAELLEYPVVGNGLADHGNGPAFGGILRRVCS
jgi:hypothetical protein